MPQVKPVPEWMHTVTPHLICAGAADAIEFYKKAFNAVEMARRPGPQGKLIHACIRIGDSTLMLVDEFPDWGSFGPKSLKGSPVTIHLQVEDVDAVVERAVSAGAKITMPLGVGAKAVKPVQDQFYGDRTGTLEDPFAHVWFLATHKEDLTPEEINKRAELSS
ncbi:MAG: VOC family protein [Candidatus Methylomirabilaceae bacterium]